MNPLGIKAENFTVVEDVNGGGIVAFAQLAPLPAQNTCEFRSLVVLPEHRYEAVWADATVLSGTFPNEHHEPTGSSCAEQRFSPNRGP